MWHSAVVQTRPICRYPSVARYTGHGDPGDASSYRCVKQPRMLPLRATSG